jgi:shikimate dehydrogenase
VSGVGSLLSIRGTTRLAAVIGDPVRHSRSPSIHNAAFAALGIDWVYLAFPVAGGQGHDALRAMRTLGIDGLSVTMPLKGEIAGAVDRRTEAVARLGACNCVARDGNELVGHNTDGGGFVAALKSELGCDPSGSRVAVIGAGGAARAIVHALGQSGVDHLVVVNRSPDNAAVAAALAPQAVVGSLDLLPDVDIVVNATSIGMEGGPPGSPVPADLLRSHHLVADIVYQPLDTPLLRDARLIGAQTIGGLGMLVHQAAIAFELWTGLAAPLDAMSEAVRIGLADA